MNEPPNRTGITNLTDDELILFDLLFDGYHSDSALSAGVYSDYLNVAYTHAYSDAELPDVLDCLEARQWIWKKVIDFKGNTRTLFTLSDMGRELWELERNPDWRSYVVTSQRELGPRALGSQMIFCMDETIGRRCGGALFASGLVTPLSGMLVRKLGSRRLIPSKSFDGVFAIRFRTKDRLQTIPRNVDWKVYSDSRCWWRGIKEMRHFPTCPDIQTKHAKTSVGRFDYR